MTFKKWWCEKCKKARRTVSILGTNKEAGSNKYAMRICKCCGEVVKEVK